MNITKHSIIPLLSVTKHEVTGISTFKVFYMPDQAPLAAHPSHLRKNRECQSQEVVARPSPASRHMPLVIWHGREDAELGAEVVVHRHDRSHITASVAVVGRRPDSHRILVGKHVLVTLLNELMRTANELQTIDTCELPTTMSVERVS